MISSKQYFVSTAESHNAHLCVHMCVCWCDVADAGEQQSRWRLRLVKANRFGFLFNYYIFFHVAKSFGYSWNGTFFLFFALQGSIYVSPFLQQPPKTCICLCIHVLFHKRDLGRQHTLLLLTQTYQPYTVALYGERSNI